MRPLKRLFFEFTEVAFWAGPEDDNEFPVIGDHLKHRFFDFIKLHFQLVQRPNISWDAIRDLETSLFRTHPSRIWADQEAENEFKVTYEPLKHRFFDLSQVAFWDGQEAENEFKVPCEPLKHRILG